MMEKMVTIPESMINEMLNCIDTAVHPTMSFRAMRALIDRVLAEANKQPVAEKEEKQNVGGDA